MSHEGAALLIPKQAFIYCKQNSNDAKQSNLRLSHIYLKFPASIYLLKVNNRSTRTRCEICSKLTIKIPERRQWRCSGIFIVNFEHISHLVLVFLLLTLNMLLSAGLFNWLKEYIVVCPIMSHPFFTTKGRQDFLE